MITDPLRLLIDAVRAARPGAAVDHGPPLAASGSPTVRVLRTPGVPHPSLWVAFDGGLPPPRQYHLTGGYADLAGAVAACLAFLDGRERGP